MFLKKWSDDKFKMQFFNICPRKGSYSMAILVQPFLKVRDKVINLDKLYYDIDVADNWYNRYIDKASVILAKENNEVLGYLLYCYITEDLYNALKNEVLIGDYSINPKQYLKEGESDIIYLASIVSKNKKASLCLLKKFRETVKGLSVNSIITIKCKGNGRVIKSYDKYR